MIHTWELATAFAIYAIVLIVPGPNMVLVFNQAIKGDRRAGVISGVGFGLAATVLAIVSYLGISSLKGLEVDIEWLMYAIPGAILIWFSYKLSIGAKTTTADMVETHSTASDAGVFSAAFILNISNPKALALLAGIYGGPLAGITVQEAVAFIIFCMLLEFVWYYILVALFAKLGASGLSDRFIMRLTTVTNFLLFIAGLFLLWQALKFWLQ